MPGPCFTCLVKMDQVDGFPYEYALYFSTDHDRGNHPGRHFRRAVDRYLESLREIYAALPDDWRVFIEHKLYEPAFYSTLLNDWGISYYCAQELGPKAQSLVDLGHHAPNVNIEMIVARLIQMKKLAGFHFNDSKYGDDDLDAGSIKPFQLFLVFNELVEAEIEGAEGFDPAYMLDQSHNITDPVESLMTSAVELVRAYAVLASSGSEQDDEIELRLGLLPGGAKEAVLSTARAALTPVVRYLWPEGRR